MTAHVVFIIFSVSALLHSSSGSLLILLQVWKRIRGGGVETIVFTLQMLCAVYSRDVLCLLLRYSSKTFINIFCGLFEELLYNEVYVCK